MGAVYAPSAAPRTVAVELVLWTFPLGISLISYLEITSVPVQFLSSTFFVVFTVIVAFKARAGLEIMKDSRNFICAAVLFWVLLDPLQLREDISLFAGRDVGEAFIYVSLFLMMVSIGYSLAPWNRLRNLFARIAEPQGGAGITWIIFALYFIGAVPVLYHSGGSLENFADILLAGYGSAAEPGWRRGAFGTDLDYLFTICFLILNVVPFFALWALRRVPLSIASQAALLAIMLSVPVLYFFSGSRRMFGFFVIGLALYVYEGVSSHYRKQMMVILLGIVIFVFLAMQVQLEYRATGFYEMDLTATETRLTNLQRDNIFYWLVVAVSSMPEQFAFTREIPFANLFIHPIPRFIWPDKPVSEGFPFVSWEQIDSTLTISVIGQFYIAQGLLGVLAAGFAYGVIGRNWDELIRGATPGGIRSSIYYMGGMLLFVLGVRSFDEVVVQWYSLAFLVLLAAFISRMNAPPRISTKCR